jgi:hypothetical protein
VQAGSPWQAAGIISDWACTHVFREVLALPDGCVHILQVEAELDEDVEHPCTLRAEETVREQMENFLQG